MPPRILMNILINYVDCDNIYHSVRVRGWFQLFKMRVALKVLGCQFVGNKPLL